MAVSRKPVSQSGAFAISIQTFFSAGSQTFLSLGHSHTELVFRFNFSFASLHQKVQDSIAQESLLSGQCTVIFSAILLN